MKARAIDIPDGSRDTYPRGLALGGFFYSGEGRIETRLRKLLRRRTRVVLLGPATFEEAGGNVASRNRAHSSETWWLRTDLDAAVEANETTCRTRCNR